MLRDLLRRARGSLMAGVATPSELLNAALEHHRAGRLPEAESAYRDLLRVDPNNVDALHFLGVLALQRGEHARAEELILSALRLNQANAPAHNNLGNALLAQGRLDEAAASFERALALDARYVDALANLGSTLAAQGKPAEAAARYRQALAIHPDLPHVHFGLASAYRDENKLNDAVTHYERAIALRPDVADGYYALGHVFRHLGLHEESLDCYEKALRIDPEYVEARWALAISQVPKIYDLRTVPSQCMTALSEQLDELGRWFDGPRLSQGYRAVGTQQPFTLAYREEDNRDILERYGRLCTRLMSAWFRAERLSMPGGRRAKTPIRVGFVSQYFWNHSVWNAIVKGWFRKLDPGRFSIHAFHLGNHRDEETLLARSLAEDFEEGSKDLRQWTSAILERQLDVLIYPEIGMDRMTLQLASLRLAPVQAVTWGHPETTGLPTMDYYLSAEDFEPAGAQANYSERLVSLAHLGCCYEPLRSEPVAPDLSRMGIDGDKPLLLCPGMPFKYAPEFDWVLAEIARGAERCQLVFFVPETARLANILRERLESAFAQRGLDFGEFGVFVPWLDSAAFSGLMERADVFLDTIGFSGFNTAMQALECGVPIVTRDGRFMRGRLASGILKRMGLQQLVAATDKDYVAQALRVIRDVEYRAGLRKLIKDRRGALYSDEKPIRDLEGFLSRVVGDAPRQSVPRLGP